MEEFREYKEGNWAMFKTMTGNWQRGVFRNSESASNGQSVVFYDYMYDSIENNQQSGLRSRERQAIPLTPELLPDLGFEKIDDVTYKKGEWELAFQLSDCNNAIGPLDRYKLLTVKNNYFSLTNSHESYPIVSEVHTLQNIIGSE